MRNTLYILLITMVTLLALSCSGSKKEKKSDAPTQKECPEFMADSAYRYIEEQCAFGPRLLGTKEADLCAEWIKAQFESKGCVVNSPLSRLRRQLPQSGSHC